MIRQWKCMKLHLEFSSHGEKDRDVWRLRLAMANSLFAQAKHNEAVKNLEKVAISIKKAPDDYKILLAAVYAKMGLSKASLTML